MSSKVMMNRKMVMLNIGPVVVSGGGVCLWNLKCGKCPSLEHRGYTVGWSFMPVGRDKVLIHLSEDLYQLVDVVMLVEIFHNSGSLDGLDHDVCRERKEPVLMLEEGVEHGRGYPTQALLSFVLLEEGRVWLESGDRSWCPVCLADR